MDVSARAGIGVGGPVGVSGDMSLIDASLPLSLSAKIAPEGITVTESAKHTMTGLDGELDLYAEVCSSPARPLARRSLTGRA